MMKNIQFFLIFGILISLTSCYTYLPISKEFPPETALSQKENPIAIVNNYNSNALGYNNEKKKQFFTLAIKI